MYEIFNDFVFLFFLLLFLLMRSLMASEYRKIPINFSFRTQTHNRIVNSRKKCVISLGKNHIHHHHTVTQHEKKKFDMNGFIEWMNGLLMFSVVLHPPKNVLLNETKTHYFVLIGLVKPVCPNVKCLMWCRADENFVYRERKKELFAKIITSCWVRKTQ